MPTLNWLTKDEDVRAAGRVPYRLLEAVPALSAGAADSGNMLVQGDNLEALKSLLPYYAGQVKCIYIDPPYNTGSAFAHYDDNLEHSVWLQMMWPRLELLRELLAEDGSIWVSIDDREGHYLKVMMDEVCGRANFMTNVIWRKNYSPKSTARHFSEDHDHIIIYAKNPDLFVPNLMPRTEKQDKAYKNPDNDPRGRWKTSDLSARNFYSEGTYAITCPGDLPPAEWPRDYDSLDHERDDECRARSTSRKRLSASCVKLRLCWRRALRPLKPAAGSRSANKPIIAGARNMAA